jgi:hypothetical protein
MYPTMPAAAIAAVDGDARVLAIAGLARLFAQLGGGMNLHEDALR